ncbi:MAG: hypothetical protein AABO58_02410 [Acidobacteriota bacterium]
MVIEIPIHLQHQYRADVPILSRLRLAVGRWLLTVQPENGQRSTVKRPTSWNPPPHLTVARP